MKFFVRALVIALAITGAVATTHANASSASAKPSISRTSAFPVPTCDPSDPGNCGMDGN
jgi:hypothetical protein